MKKLNFILILSIMASSFSCKESSPDIPIDTNTDKAVIVPQPKNQSDSLGLLTYIQKVHFEYMWSGACPNSGLARVRFLLSNPTQDQYTITTGASGFGIMGLIVGIERKFITRAQGIARLEKIVSFLEKTDKYHGMFPHWVDDQTGKTIAFAGSNGDDNGADIVETAFLTSGILCARQYLINGTDNEKALAGRFDAIWKGMEWNWFVSSDKCLIWHWSPTVGFKLNVHLQGYNETLLTYVLAAASPTHPIDDPKGSYQSGWFRAGAMKNSGSRYGIPFIVKHNTGSNDVGPMFWVAFSYGGLNPKGLTDENGVNYWQVQQSHSKIQYNYCVENPKKWNCFGPNSWGLTAGYSINDSYVAHSTKTDDGVISPNAALIAMPYTPQESMYAAKNYYWNMPQQMGPWGFWDAFCDNEGTIKKYLANNQCPVAPMIENYRTGLLWNLFMSSPEISIALQKLGFVIQK